MAATLKDVAQVAGVNFTLVSKLINQPDISIRPETRKRIEDAIRTLNYRPSRSARALRLGCSDLIGLAVGDLTNEFFAHYADCALEESEKCGGRLLISIVRKQDPEKAIHDLMNDQLCGILSCFPTENSGSAICPVREAVSFTPESMHQPLAEAADFLYQERNCRSSAVLYTGSPWQAALVSSDFQKILPGTAELAKNGAQERLAQLHKICKDRPDVIFTTGWKAAEMLCDLLDTVYCNYRPAVLLSANCRGPFLEREHIAGVFYHSTRQAIARAVQGLLSRRDSAEYVPPGQFFRRGTAEFQELYSAEFCLT